MFVLRILDHRGQPIQNFDSGVTLNTFIASVPDPAINVSNYPDSSIKSVDTQNTVDYHNYKVEYQVTIRVNGHYNLAAQAVLGQPDVWNVDVTPLARSFRVVGIQGNTCLSISISVLKLEKFYEVVKYGKIDTVDPSLISYFYNTLKKSNDGYGGENPFFFISGFRNSVVPPYVGIDSNDVAIRKTYFSATIDKQYLSNLESIPQYPVQLNFQNSLENSIFFGNKFGF